MLFWRNKVVKCQGKIIVEVLFFYFLAELEVNPYTGTEYGSGSGHSSNADPFLIRIRKPAKK
jgi:hypothetical protein